MPFVRYARDRRGYETLYVMHAFDGAERNPRPRVLYACRTVPYAKVGRMTIDETVQRRLETAYPNLSFDWPKLLKEAAQSAPRPERTEQQRQERKGRGRKKEPRDQVQKVREVRPVRQVQAPEPPPVEQPPPVEELAETPQPLEPITELIEWSGALEPGTEPVEPMEPAEPMEPEVQVPEVVPALVVDRAWPVVDSVGADRALILRARFIELASKVVSRVSDPQRRQRLFREAARLNPEAWRTAEEVRAGLDAFETVHARVLEQLRQQPPV